MTTGRINQITLCRPVPSVKTATRPPRAETPRRRPQHGACSNEPRTEKSNGLLLSSLRKKKKRRPEASHAEFRENYRCKSFARCEQPHRGKASRQEFLSRPCYHGSGVPTQYKVTRVIRRVKEHKRLRHPGSGTSFQINQARAMR